MPTQDERIPLKYLEQPLSGLTGIVVVRKKFYSGEDHFLILSRREDVLQDVFNWMAAW